MKRIIAGGIMMLSGILLFLGAHIPAALYSTNLKGWSTPPGRYGTAIEVTGGEPITTYAIILCVIGFLLLVWGSMIEVIISKYKHKETFKSFNGLD